MKNENIDFVKQQIVELHNIVEKLNERFSHKKFTLDGRLVGDLGEIIAEQIYDLELFKKVEKYYDGVTADNKRVQIKVTFKDHLTFNHCPDYYLGLKFNENGDFKEIFNGKGEIIKERYKHRKNIGKQLLSFPINELKKLSESVKKEDRIQQRK
jgi:hypothetical protein